MNGKIKRNTKCRVCNSTQLYNVFSLGEQPLANRFLTEQQLTEKEDKFPLEVYFCNKCSLLQLIDVVKPELLFSDYAYFTGASAPLVQHFDVLACETIKKYDLTRSSIVLDIGSNDGTCLKQFKKRGIKVVGVDPSINVSKVANDNGILTYTNFWDCETKNKIKSEHGKVDIIIATNVLAHVDEVQLFIKNVADILKSDGKFVFEVPYLKPLIENGEYDTIYHEHLSYFSIATLKYLLKRYELKIMEVESLEEHHGGTIRVTAEKNKKNRCNKNELNYFLQEEENLERIETYIDFGIETAEQKKLLRVMLQRIKNKGEQIIGYGATAKGNVLLNYCNIDANIISYIVDTTPYKQGKYTPGTHIPIVSDKGFLWKSSKSTLLLAWNYANEITEKEKKYIELGGKFIHPHKLQGEKKKCLMK